MTNKEWQRLLARNSVGDGMSGTGTESEVDMSVLDPRYSFL
jgi:hypothetical protein